MECTQCKSQVTDEVSKYSNAKFGVILCMRCQKSAKQDLFDYNMIKGRIAEALIEQLFIRLDYKVYRYGMENTIPGIMQLLGKVKTEVSNIIRRMPDLVIQNHKGEAFFVEVKFRKEESFSIKDLDESKYGEYPFPNAYFVVVSKKHIKCLSYFDLRNGKEITPKCSNFLGNIKEFEADKETIIQFCNYASGFFEGVE